MMNTVPTTKESVLSYSSPLFMKAPLNKETHTSHKSKKLLTPLKENPSLSYGLKVDNNSNSKKPSKLEDPVSPLFSPLPLKKPKKPCLCNPSELKIYKLSLPKSEVVNKYSTTIKLPLTSKLLPNGMEKINPNLMNYDFNYF